MVNPCFEGGLRGILSDKKTTAACLRGNAIGIVHLQAAEMNYPRLERVQVAVEGLYLSTQIYLSMPIGCDPTTICRGWGLCWGWCAWPVLYEWIRGLVCVPHFGLSVSGMHASLFVGIVLSRLVG